jgi:hypothetical protein
MAASMERLQDYRMYNSQFCKRVFDAMQMMFLEQVRDPFSVARLLTKANFIFSQSKFLTAEASRSTSSLVLQSHQGLESALGLYSGLILYLKEMDEDRYSKLCAVGYLNMFCTTLLMREFSPTLAQRVTCIIRK